MYYLKIENVPIDSYPLCPIPSNIKIPPVLHQGLDHERPQIADKYTEIFMILDCIPRAMVIWLHLASRALISTTLRYAHSVKIKGQTVQTGERPQANGQTNGRTDTTKRIISQLYGP